MAATKTVPQVPHPDNCDPITTKLLVPRNGIVTLSGYGIKINVNRGHLVFEDGIGAIRGHARLPRVRHGLRRLIVIGSDGIVSLAALRWLADQDAAFVMLERDGSVLAVTGPVAPSDARLRRAQSLANQTVDGLWVARELIDRKLAAQEQVTLTNLTAHDAAQAISIVRSKLVTADTIDSIRFLESQAARIYWSAWRNIPINFPRNDLRRVPEHWQTFGARISPLTGSPRLAVNPPNAMLNFLYALLESEARLAAAALGLDPGLGVMHVDSKSRDSLASDLMEPVRPKVDAYVLDWINREPLRREWFFEQRDGNCRLMGSFAAQLSRTAETWGRAVAPVAEWISRTLWSSMQKHSGEVSPATRLTGHHRRIARNGSPTVASSLPPNPPRVCRGCGASVTWGRNYCGSCGVVFAKGELIEAAKRGRIAAQSFDAQASRSETQRRNTQAQLAWKPSDLPDWLTENVYTTEIHPRLSGITVSVLALAIGVSKPYAADIRAGRRLPHPRHWERLGQLVCLSHA
jgi:CRISPR-associated endonuclease Cas1